LLAATSWLSKTVGGGRWTAYSCASARVAAKLAPSALAERVCLANDTSANTISRH